MEVHTCGVVKKITIQFLFSLQSCGIKLDQNDQRKEQHFSKTQNVSEQIKNEILPLINPDDDIDDLDDEVAMISNKKSATSKNMKLKDLIFVDDIKVEIKENKSQTLLKKSPKN